MLQLINSTDLDLLASFVFGNRCPVVREDASWAIILIMSPVVQDSVFRRLLCTRVCFVACFPSFVVTDAVSSGCRLQGAVFFLLCVWPSCRVPFCAFLVLWLDRDFPDSNDVLQSVCCTCMFVIVCGWIGLVECCSLFLGL